MKVTGDCGYSQEAIQAILDAPIPFTKEGAAQEEELTEKLVATLSDEQVEAAAQSSYAYWLASLRGDHHKLPTAEERLKMAKREARRHLVKVSYEEACTDIVESLKYREEYRVNLLRACFQADIEVTDEGDRAYVEDLRSSIRDDLGREKGYVHGHDKEGRALLIVRSREIVAADEEAFVKAILFLMERAIASTESYTAATQEKILVVLDFAQFSSSLSPSLTTAKTVAKILQRRYTERLFRLIVIDPPFWMRTMYSLVKPFLTPITMTKFFLITGDVQKHETLSGFIEGDQAMPFMLPEGQLPAEVDLEKYLTQTPFQCGYGELR